MLVLCRWYFYRFYSSLWYLYGLWQLGRWFNGKYPIQCIHTFSAWVFEQVILQKFKNFSKTLKIGVLHCRVTGDTNIRNCFTNLLWTYYVCIIWTEVRMAAVGVLLYGSGYVCIAVSFCWLLSQVCYTFNIYTFIVRNFVLLLCRIRWFGEKCQVL